MQDACVVADPVPPCPRCPTARVVRNGHNRSGSANVLCRGCGRPFVARPRKGPVPDATQELVRRLLRERVALRAIARAVGVSRSWLPRFAHRLDREDTIGALWYFIRYYNASLL